MPLLPPELPNVPRLGETVPSAPKEMPPLLSWIIMGEINQATRFTVIGISSEAYFQDREKKELVVTNPTISCMTVKSITTESTADAERIILHEVNGYFPGGVQKLQKVYLEHIEVNLSQNDLVQVNGEILTAAQFVKRFKTIPAKRQPN